MKGVRIFGLWFLVLACLGAPGLCARDYFVSPQGNDLWPGTLLRPFKSLRHAVPIPKPGDTLYLRQGVYRETLYVARAGTASAPIVFSGYGAETAVLAGSEPLTGTWQRWHGHIWTMAGVSPTSEVYLDGQELSEARWPAVPVGADMRVGWAVAGAGTCATELVDPKLPDLPLVGASVHIIPGLAWVSYTRTIQSYSKGRLAYADPICGTTPDYCPRPGNRYFLYNSLALLNSPGQWYQDPVTGRLYVWCPDSCSPVGRRMEAARRKAVLLDAGFSHIQIRNLYTFSGGIKISGCLGCRVTGVRQRYVQHFMDVQGYYEENPTNSLYGGSDCEWDHGSIEGSSGDGLAVSGVGQRVDHMLIHDVCRAGGYAAALALLQSDQVVEDNTFYDSGRYLINLGNARGGDIEYNDLHGAGLLTADVGALYSYRTDGGGMVIAYNRVHHVPATRGIGIYLDNGDSNYVVLHNLVTDCAWSALELNLPSFCNVVCGNTLWNCKHWIWADGAPHSMTGTVLVNNLYEGSALMVRNRGRAILGGNATYLQPPALFAPGGYTLAKGSWARGRGVVLPPYTDDFGASTPDQGAFRYGQAAWTAGCGCALAPFPYPAEFPLPQSLPDPAALGAQRMRSARSPWKYRS